MSLKVLAGVVLLSLAVWGGTPTPSPTPAASIGTATMDSHGTIVLMLRAEDGKGTLGDGRFEYRPGDPKYKELLEHLGGLKPGQTKPVPPWK